MQRLATLSIAILLVLGTAACQNGDEDGRNEAANGGTENGRTGAGNGEQQGPAGRESGAVKAGYTAYSNEDLGFSLMYPEDATVSTPGANRVTFKFLGPDNEQGTEITDGFTFTVHREPSVSAQSAQAYAQSLTSEENLTPDQEVVAQPEQRQVSGMTAYRYRMETALGPVATTYAFMPSPGEGYTVTYMIAGSGYQNMVNTMLESISFTPGDAAAQNGVRGQNGAAAQNGATDRNGAPQQNNGTAQNDAPVFSSIKIALLDYPAADGRYQRESNGETIGCEDRVVMVQRDIEPTTAPLTAAMNELFSLEDTEVEGWQNFIAQTNETLSFERARVILTTGEASIFLSGRLSGLGGVCDNPRARAQIIHTARQFPNITDVQIYLNGEPTDLQPSGRG